MQLLCWYQSLEFLNLWEPWTWEYPEALLLAPTFVHVWRWMEGIYMKNPEENLNCHSSSSLYLASEFTFVVVVLFCFGYFLDGGSLMV